jgi:hypothetical protein
MIVTKWHWLFSRFTDLTGTDYSEGAIELARNIATRDGFTSIIFLVSVHVQIELYLSCPTFFFETTFFAVMGIILRLRIMSKMH